jgi:hypothetical protein
LQLHQRGAPAICFVGAALLSNNSFSIKIDIDKTNVTTFAIHTGGECDSTPYTSHPNVPVENTRNIVSEMSRALRSRITRSSCGINEIVVIVAAA